MKQITEEIDVQNISWPWYKICKICQYNNSQTVLTTSQIFLFAQDGCANFKTQIIEGKLS